MQPRTAVQYHAIRDRGRSNINSIGRYASCHQSAGSRDQKIVASPDPVAGYVIFSPR
ncbi:hypothetical protein SAMN05519103_09230 [Rhizobiales bacterium GAS113]|nr:hypothetical protein SAMN05519103_09230 [Rhizobiales bacterium GAS113]